MNHGVDCKKRNTGKVSLCWMGTTPRLIVMDPELMKEVLSNKLGHFEKPPLNPLILALTKGLTTQQGEKLDQTQKDHKSRIPPGQLEGFYTLTSCIPISQTF